MEKATDEEKPVQPALKVRPAAPVDEGHSGAGYIGNHSVHLTTSYNFGTLPAQYLSTSMVRDQATINALSAVVANQFANLLPGSTLNGSTISVSNLLRPFPEFTGVTEGNMNNGGSYYHSANVRIQRRFRGGLQSIRG